METERAEMEMIYIHCLYATPMLRLVLSSATESNEDIIASSYPFRIRVPKLSLLIGVRRFWRLWDSKGWEYKSSTKRCRTMSLVRRALCFSKVRRKAVYVVGWEM